MKERLVKGRHVRGVIELLEAEGRLETLPELAPPGADLIRRPVYATTWYQLRAFEDLLQSVHRYVFDGSEAAGQKMGRLLAEKHFSEPRTDAALEPSASVGELLANYWKAHFNFGAVGVLSNSSVPVSEIRLQITGYPDMSSCHGHLVMGWSVEAMLRTTGHEPELHVEERPWMHNSSLTYTLSVH